MLIVPGRPQHRSMVSARVSTNGYQVTFYISVPLVEKLRAKPGRVALSIESNQLVFDLDPSEGVETYSLFHEGSSKNVSLSVGVAKSKLPPFPSHRWFDPVVRGRKIFLPLNRETLAKWMKGREA